MNNLTIIEIFNRTPKNESKYQSYIDSVHSKFNLESVNRVFFNVKHHFNIETYDDCICYCFSLVKNWIYQNEMYSETYLNGLEKLIKKLSLERLLNSWETEYISHFKSVVFSKKRNLKRLIVDFPLLKISKFKQLSENVRNQESPYYRFDTGKLFLGTVENFFFQGKIFLTDLRLVIINEFYFVGFDYEKIETYKVYADHFEFFYNGKKYIIITDDNFTFHVSFERCSRLLEK